MKDPERGSISLPDLKHLHTVTTLFYPEHDVYTFPDPDIVVLESVFFWFTICIVLLFLCECLFVLVAELPFSCEKTGPQLEKSFHSLSFN